MFFFALFEGYFFIVAFLKKFKNELFYAEIFPKRIYLHVSVRLTISPHL